MNKRTKTITPINGHQFWQGDILTVADDKNVYRVESVGRTWVSVVPLRWHERVIYRVKNRWTRFKRLLAEMEKS